MEVLLILLVLLLAQTIETSSQPHVADSQNCLSPYKYITETSGLCCSRCSPGHKLKKECTETNDTVCEPCGSGLHMGKWNFAPNCLSCTKCKMAKGLRYVEICSSTTNAKCSCMIGRYCYTRISTECEECVLYRTCKEGFGVLQPGTNMSNVRCQKCQEGTFSDTVSSTDVCKAHQVCDESDIISKGNATSDTVCKSVASAQTNPMFNNKPETTVIATTASQLRKPNTVKSKSIPMYTTNSTTPGIFLISTTKMPNSTKKQMSDTGPDNKLVVVIGTVAGIFLLIVVIVLLVLYKGIAQKFALEGNTKVDTNGNCETDIDKTNLCYLGDTHHLSVNIVQPELQCFLQNGTVDQNHCNSKTDDYNSNQSIQPLPSTLLHQPAFSEPLPLQSNVDQFVYQNVSTVQTSSQPTSPQNMTTSPLVKVTPDVMQKDMTPAEPKIPFGEEEEGYSLPQQEDGKPSLLSVEESGSFNNEILKTLNQYDK